MSTIVITGANRGIGLALAEKYQQQGDHVIAVCRQGADTLDALGVQVEQGIDITDSASLTELQQRMSGQAIDVLINNAGILRSTTLDNIEDELERYRAQFEVNSLGPLRVTQALSSQLRQGAKVIIVTSRMGSIADNTSGGAYGYRMSKSAVNSAGVSLAHALKPHGIAVALLHPGYVRTDMTGQNGYVDPDEAAQGLMSRIAALSMDTTGSFWHANGETLPW